MTWPLFALTAATSTPVDSIRITAPEADAVLFNEVKDHVRVTDEAEEAILTGFMDKAVDYVEKYTGLALIEQTWIDYFDGVPAKMVLSRRPLIALQRLEDDYGSSPVAPIGAEFYALLSRGYNRPARIALSGGWPRTTDALTRAIGVVYTAGFGKSWADVPAVLCHAIKIAAAIGYDARGSAFDYSPVHMLLEDWRPFGVA